MRRLLFAGMGNPLTQPAWTTIPLQTLTTGLIVKRRGRFVCGVCNKSYVGQSNCKKHLNDLHILLGSTTCEICNIVLADRVALSRHMAKHLGTNRCEKCNKTYATKYDLKKHKNSKFKCG